MNFDPTDIGSVIGAMYAIISGPPGARDWSQQEHVFHPEARLWRTGADENGISWLKSMNMFEYRDNTAIFFSVAPFYEVETARRLEVFGNIAQAWSTYEERRTPDGPSERRGVNSIQLFHDENGHWRIMSIIWDNERDGLTLSG